MSDWQGSGGLVQGQSVPGADRLEGRTPVLKLSRAIPAGRPTGAGLLVLVPSRTRAKAAQAEDVRE